MCGIFGIACSEKARPPVRAVECAIRALFLESEARGKEASGLAVASRNTIEVYKEPRPASVIVRSDGYKTLLRQTLRNGDGRSGGRLEHAVLAIGHSRLVTNGSAESEGDNQPVLSGGLVGVHNGIIVNADDLWACMPDVKREYRVDSEILLALLQYFRNRGESIVASTCRTFGLIRGAASIAVLFEDSRHLLLATNTGSLYLTGSDAGGIWMFASERLSLHSALGKRSIRGWADRQCISQVSAGRAALIDLDRATCTAFELRPDGGGDAASDPFGAAAASSSRQQRAHGFRDKSASPDACQVRVPFSIVAHGEATAERIASLRRCTRCILPETMPLISFDAEGVCNYCRCHEPHKTAGEQALRDSIQASKSKAGGPDCLVNLSGGRDSSFALHYLRRELGLRTLAYTYDWGMITDLARRNISRLCADLGVEHILISADITQKRANIRSNVRSWLRRPDLGMIPLFMAGDKKYFYYSVKTARRYGCGAIIAGRNPLEKTYFKSGFCGIQEGPGTPYDIPVTRKLRIAAYYGWQFARNPGYLNVSLFDTAGAYLASYFMQKNFLCLFEYIHWDEGRIVDTLIEDYDWEIAGDSANTWRIGDGTAAFYNYIYYIVAGFSEHDTFLSNQVRESLLTRDEAMERARESNKPRFDAIKWYLDTIGMGNAFEDVLKTIDAMPAIY